MKRILCLTSLLALLMFLAVSCQDPDDGWKEVADGEEIWFLATADGDGTKAADITTANISEFTCTAYPAGTATTPYFSSVAFTGAGSPKRFNSANAFYWPTSGLDFWAHSPSSSTQISKANYKTFVVTPSTTPSSQVDLVYACATSRTRALDGASGTTLNFRHAASKVSVKVKNTSSVLRFEVTGWKVGYLATSGTFTFPGGSTAGSGTIASSAWSGNTTRSAANTYTSTFSTVAVAASASTGVTVGTDMILVPQTTSAATAYASSSSGAALNGSYIAVQIRILDAVSGIQIKAATWAVWPVALSWQPGKVYTYTVDLAGGGYYETNTSDGNADLDAILENGVMTITATVTDWNTVNAGTISI